MAGLGTRDETLVSRVVRYWDRDHMGQVKGAYNPNMEKICCSGYVGRRVRIIRGCCWLWWRRVISGRHGSLSWILLLEDLCAIIAILHGFGIYRPEDPSPRPPIISYPDTKELIVLTQPFPLLLPRSLIPPSFIHSGYLTPILPLTHDLDSARLGVRD